MLLSRPYVYCPPSSCLAFSASPLVCLCVCPRAYLQNCSSNLYNILLHVTYDRVLVILSWRSGTFLRYVLPVLWLTTYLHIMGHTGACRHRGSEWRHCVVVSRLTSLLRRKLIGCFCYGRRWAPFAVRSLHTHSILHSRLLQAWNLASNFFTHLDHITLLLGRSGRSSNWNKLYAWMRCSWRAGWSKT